MVCLKMSIDLSPENYTIQQCQKIILYIETIMAHQVLTYFFTCLAKTCFKFTINSSLTKAEKLYLKF